METPENQNRHLNGACGGAHCANVGGTFPQGQRAATGPLGRRRADTRAGVRRSRRAIGKKLHKPLIA
jgi:hypothetical protein